MSDLSYISGLDRVTLSAEKAADGLIKITSAIDGFYDDLILYQRSWEEWENKSFNIRAQEIEKQAALGTVSTYDQAMMWKELTDTYQYGWQNVWKAEENYYNLLYQHSKEWIEDQIRLGELSEEQIAEAWQRVYDKFDSIDVKYEAVVNIREVLLAGAEEDINARRTDSDRWMARQDLYDGGDFRRQYKDYQRRINSEFELLREIESGVLNGAQLGAEEIKTKWFEVYSYIEDLQDQQYTSAKSYLEQAASDYIDAVLKNIDDEYEATKKSYESQLNEVNSYYDEIIKKRREAQREDDLEELYRLKSYYKDAVTKEGQDKYDDFVRQIEDIENDMYEDSLEDKREDRISAIKSEMEKAEDEYRATKENIEDIYNQILGLTGSVTLQGMETSIAFGDTLVGLTEAITGNVENIFQNSEQALAGYIENIARLASSSFTDNSSKNNVSVTVNDYGSKNLYNESAFNDYSQIFTNAVNSAFRVWGGK